MSVLYIQKRPGRGGAQTCLARLVGHPSIAALDPVVLTSQDGWLTEECDRLGVQTIIEPFPSSRSLKARLWGTRQFAEHVAIKLQEAGIKPSLVHANDHLEGLIGKALMRRFGIPGVMTLRSPGMSQRDLIKYRCADYQAITAVGQRIKDNSNRWVGAARVQLVHDGLAADEFDELKHVSGEPPDRVLVIGSELDWKGWSDLTDALAIAHEQAMPAPSKVDFTGPPPDPSVNNLGLDRFDKNRFRFLGRVLGFKDLVQRYDLVINPSRMETFGMAAVETIAAGVPLLSTRVGVLEEVLQSDAMLCRPHDPEDLSRAMGHIYGSWVSLKEQGFGLHQAQANLRDKYAMDQTAKGYLEAYEGLRDDG